MCLCPLCLEPPSHPSVSPQSTELSSCAIQQVPTSHLFHTWQRTHVNHNLPVCPTNRRPPAPAPHNSLPTARLMRPFSPAASLFLRAWFLWDGNSPAAAWPPVTPTWQNNGSGPPATPPTVHWQGGSWGEVAQEVTEAPAFSALGNRFKIFDASYPKIIS